VPQGNANFHPDGNIFPSKHSKSFPLSFNIPLSDTFTNEREFPKLGSALTLEKKCPDWREG
jgi:hypothetical protein